MHREHITTLPREMVSCQAGSYPPTNAGHRRHPSYTDTPVKRQPLGFSLVRIRRPAFGGASCGTLGIWDGQNEAHFRAARATIGDNCFTAALTAAPVSWCAGRCVDAAFKAVRALSRRALFQAGRDTPVAALEALRIGQVIASSGMSPDLHVRVARRSCVVD
jgi:hypothetical protein